MIRSLRAPRRPRALPAIALRLAERLEEVHGHEAARVGHGGVARLVPVGVVLARDDVEEVAFLEAELLRVLRFVVV